MIKQPLKPKTGGSMLLYLILLAATIAAMCMLRRYTSF
jgi:hypothetical protein